MSSATAAADKSATKQSDIAMRLVPRASKRSVVPMVGGVLLILVFALVFGVASMRSGTRVAVLVVNKPIPAGAVISASDLKSVRIASDNDLHPIAASRMSDIVGKSAAVTLLPGTLLVDSQLQTASGLTANEAQVGLSLKAGQYPPDLAVGSTVRVVQSDAASNLTLVAKATVLSIGSPDANNGNASVIGLKVPSDSANAVVGASSASHVSLVQIAAVS